MLRATTILFTMLLRRVLVSKRALVCFLIACGPVLAAILIARIAEEEGPPPTLIVLWSLQVQLVVPIVSLVMGSAIVAEEVEDRTVTYLFTRPFPRAAVLLGRWLASLVVLLAILLSTSAVVVAILAEVGSADPESALPVGSEQRILLTVALGAATYSAVFGALGALLKHPMIVGLGYAFAVEGFLANLPGGGQSLTIQYFLKSFLAGGSPEIRERIGHIALFELASPEAAATRLVTILLAALVLGSLTVSRKEYVLSS